MEKRYGNLENLLFRGFIPLKLQVNGVNIILKTINDHEYEKIKMMSGLENDPRFSIFFSINYLFYSIYMIDGMNILKTREDLYSDFYDVLKELPTVFYKGLFSHLEYLTKCQNDCSILVEQYSLEAESRYHWESKKRSILNDPMTTSVDGTNLLGLNQFQKYWTVVNLREDRKDKFEQDYGLAKFLASFQDPKAIRKIEASEKVKKEEDEKRKERLRVMGTEEEVKYLSNPTDTREGIIKELERQMTGDKDEHDLYIEEYEKKIRKEMLLRMHDIKKIRDSRKKEMDDLGDEVRSISKIELEERMNRMRERKEKNINTFEETPEQNSKFYQMSNIDDSDLIREEDFLSEDDYQKLTGEDDFKAVTGVNIDQNKKNKIDEEYKRQQKTLASKFNYDEDYLNLDFPHIKRKLDD